MKCMKCGRELESEQVFCDDCLLEMKKYPVSPSITVHVPLRRETAPVRKPQSHRRSLSPEEQIKTLKKRVWTLAGALIVTVALLLAMIHPTVNYFLRHYYLRPGQNYNTITTPVTTEPESK